MGHRDARSCPGPVCREVKENRHKGRERKGHACTRNENVHLEQQKETNTLGKCELSEEKSRGGGTTHQHLGYRKVK